MKMKELLSSFGKDKFTIWCVRILFVLIIVLLLLQLWLVFQLCITYFLIPAQ